MDTSPIILNAYMVGPGSRMGRRYATSRPYPVAARLLSRMGYLGWFSTYGGAAASTGGGQGWL